MFDIRELRLGETLFVPLVRDGRVVLPEAWVVWEGAARAVALRLDGVGP